MRLSFQAASFQLVDQKMRATPRQGAFISAENWPRERLSVAENAGASQRHLPSRRERNIGNQRQMPASGRVAKPPRPESSRRSSRSGPDQYSARQPIGRATYFEE